jgi:hypothetical protein
MSRHQDSFDRNIAGARQQLIEQLTQLSKSFFALPPPGPRRALAGVVETEKRPPKCSRGWHEKYRQAWV